MKRRACLILTVALLVLAVSAVAHGQTLERVQARAG